MNIIQKQPNLHSDQVNLPGSNSSTTNDTLQESTHPSNIIYVDSFNENEDTGDAATVRLESSGTVTSTTPTKRQTRTQRMIIDVDAFIENDTSDDDIDVKTTKPFSSPKHESQRCSTNIPSPTVFPNHSPSQKAAINLVLKSGCDDSGKDAIFKKNVSSGLSVNDQTADLTDDEIAAVIPPILIRHGSSSNSTPGAFPSLGAAGLTPNFRYSTSNTMGASATTIVSATLVREETDSHHSDISSCRNDPVLVYAEPLWWKRRLVLCLSAWVLLAVTVISVSITVAIQLTNNDRNESLENNNPGPDNPTTISPTLMKKATEFPTQTPTTGTSNDTALPTVSGETPMSFHAVSWGKISSCDDNNFYTLSSDIILSCGGNLNIEKVENVTCQSVRATGTSNETDTSRTSCKINVTESHQYIVSGDLYTKATGMVVFSCRGTNNRDRSAIAELPITPVSNCSSTNIGSAFAASFISLGRFCRNRENEWSLKHGSNPCEKGQPKTIKIPRELFDSSRSKNLSRNASSFGNNENRRSLQLIDLISDLLDVTTFCSGTKTCLSLPTESTCSLQIPEIRISEPVNGQCADPIYRDNSTYSLDDLWNIAQPIFEPSSRFNNILSDLP